MTISSIGSNPLSGSSSTQHTYGLSGSGIDVDAQVKALMKAASVPYTSMWQKEQVAEWKKAEYNTVYTAVSSFRTNTVFNYTLQNTLMPQTVASGNSAVATATATADAADVNHILNVTHLATGVTESSSGKITTGSAKDTLANQFGLNGGSFAINITNNGVSKSITVDPSESIYQLVSDINNAGVNAKASYDATLDRFFLYTTNTGSSASIDFTGSSTAGVDFLTNKLKLGVVGAGTAGTTSSADVTDTSRSSAFTLQLTNGSTTKSITIDPIETMSDIVSAINGAGVSASASFDGSKFTLKTTSGTLSLTGSDPAAISFLTNQLHLPAAATGQDAQFTLDGASLSESSNSFTVSGVSYKLQSTGSTTLSVSTDIDKIVSNVKSFIDSYNTVLAKLNDEADQTVYRDYTPLTDDQKSSMKDSDITAWNAKAKSGLLHSEDIVRSAIDDMRNNVADPISGLTGKYNSAASIGITTGDYTEEGKLYLDENKLRTALQADPSIVQKIFGSTTTATDSTAVSKEGIAVRLNDSLKKTVEKITTEAGITADTDSDTQSNLAKEIKDYKTRLSDMSDRLEDLQTRYYNQYDAMEEALNQLNQKSAWISNMLGQ